MQYRLLNGGFLLLAVAAVVLALDPYGAYFGVRTTWQYALLVGIVTWAALVGILGKSRPDHVIMLVGALAVMAVAMSRIGWSPDGLSTSVIRIALIPYVVVCAYVASRLCISASLFRWVAIAAGLLVAVSLLAWRWGGYLDGLHQLYHEEIFLIAPFMLLLVQHKRKAVRVVGLVLGVSALVASNKFTAFGVLLVIASTLFIAFSRSRFWRRRKNMLWTVGAFLSVLTVVPLAVFYLATSAEAPTGSVDVRSYTYALRLRQFFSEPILGGAGSDSAEIFVRHKMFVIPSHSDFLDVIAYCGLFGLVVFFVPLIQVLRAALKLLRLDMLALLASIILVSTVNPLLYQPPFLALLAASIFFLRGARNDEG